MKKKEFKSLLFIILGLGIFLACERNVETDPLIEEDKTETTNAVSNVKDHDADSDYVWTKADVVPIILEGNSISIDGEGATIIGSTITINSAGTYSFSGTLNDGQVVVDTKDDAIVRLILDNVSLSCSYSSPIYVSNADKAMLVLADGSVNTITDGSTYTSGDDGPNAAIYSADNLTLYGTGSLTVNGNYEDGICSKDGLIIASGTYFVKAKDDGIRGKDYLVVKTGDITVEAGGDGLKSDNDEDAEKGYISILDGIFNINSTGDALTAETDILISDGILNLVSGNGASSSTASTKGIKAGVMVSINNGSLVIDATDDAIHSNQDIEINGGILSLASGDDGIHSDYNTIITSGTINITKSYEGLESALGSITMSGGHVYIAASDDGINISAGGGTSGGGPGRKSSAATDCALNITGGYLVVDCEGDGLDSNDFMNISGGTMIVNSDEYTENSSIDCDGTCSVNGGLLVTFGVSQMAQAPGSSSSQYSIMVNFKSRLSANTIIHIEDGDGSNIITCQSIKSFESFIFSSSVLKNGLSYKIYVGGNSTGTLVDGIYSGGIYTLGTLNTSLTISSRVTTKNL